MLNLRTGNGEGKDLVLCLNLCVPVLPEAGELSGTGFMWDGPLFMEDIADSIVHAIV